MEFLSYLIIGVSLGSVYAIIALGYTMVYGIAKMLNFAHGDVIMVGGYISLLSMTSLGLPWWAGVLLAILVCTVLGVVIEGLAYKPLRASPSLAVLITAIGVSYFLQNAAQLLWGASPMSYTPIVSGSLPVGGLSIIDFCSLPVTRALEFVEALPSQLSARDMVVAERILKEIRSRLNFLASVGLQYLTLSRAAATLSGGESQRIRLATQIGSSLMGVLYILDEPSIGLHQRDNDKLLDTLRRLRDLGNTLIVVEHDEDTMRSADYIIDVGPGAGVHGGHIVAAGTPEEVAACEASYTGQYLKRMLK